MAFSKKTWTDRLSEYATRRILTDQDTGTVSVVEVARSEGTIYQQGDAFSAANMNDLEDRIAAGFTSVNNGLGPVEDLEGTASQAYPVNAYFVGNDGYFYKVIEAIDQGDAFVTTGTGANCTQTNVASELASGGGGGGGSGIRYVEEDDMIQLSYGGRWRDWLSPGMAYPIGTEIDFAYSNAIQQFTVPANGTWKIEAYGAKGGNGSSSYQGGYGGYSYGNIILHKDDILYICTGQKGSTCSLGGSTGATYNGGGGAVSERDGSSGSYAGSGGGATHVAKQLVGTGILADYSNTIDREKILIVAGGGGGGFVDYTSSGRNANGGSGGGTAGGNGNGGSGSSAPAGGTQTTGNAFGVGGTAGNFGAGGGGGWYGGKYAFIGSAGGGSGHINETELVVGTTGMQNGINNDNGYVKFTYVNRNIT